MEAVFLYIIGNGIETKLKNKEIFEKLLAHVAKGLGPSLYHHANVDIEDQTEIENIKLNFLEKKLGISLNENNVQKFNTIIFALNPQIINRAILYTILIDSFDKVNLFMDHNIPEIVQNPTINDGRPSIKGTRISVGMILEKMAGGDTVSDILDAYPHLTKEQVEEAIKYGARIANEKVTFLIA
jgi:uncharacterized protein (DUF433 family)